MKAHFYTCILFLSITQTIVLADILTSPPNPTPTPWQAQYTLTLGSYIVQTAMNEAEAAQMLTGGCADEAECFCGVPRDVFMIENGGSDALLCRHPGIWIPDVASVSEADAETRGKSILDPDCSYYKSRLESASTCYTRSRQMYAMHENTENMRLTTDGCAAVVFNNCWKHFDMAEDTLSECCPDIHAAMQSWTTSMKSQYEKAASDVCATDLQQVGEDSDAGKNIKRFFKPWELSANTFCYEDNEQLERRVTSSASLMSRDIMLTLSGVAFSTLTVHLFANLHL